MSIIAKANIDNGEVKGISVEPRYPTKKENLTFYEGVEKIKIEKEMPKKIRGLFYAVKFKSDKIVMAKDVLGSKPLYYNKKMSVSSFKRFVEDCMEVGPGEYVEITYDGEMVRKEKYTIEDVFKPGEFERAEIEERIIKSLERFKLENACISFSGGVDSSFLAYLYDIPLFSVTASKAEAERIKESAKLLNRDVEIIHFNHKTVEEVLRDVINAIETTNPLQVSIAIPIYLVMRHAKNAGFTQIVFGQGADELFGGYKRYENIIGKNLEQALLNDIKNIGINNSIRDTKLAYTNEISLVTPYLSFDVIESALSIPPELKIYREGGEVIRKYFLRELAVKFIPRTLAYRDKKAIQYSTNTYKILEKLSRKAGMSLQEFLKGLEWR